MFTLASPWSSSFFAASAGLWLLFAVCSMLLQRKLTEWAIEQPPSPANAGRYRDIHRRLLWAPFVPGILLWVLILIWPGHQGIHRVLIGGGLLILSACSLADALRGIVTVVLSERAGHPVHYFDRRTALQASIGFSGGHLVVLSTLYLITRHPSILGAIMMTTGALLGLWLKARRSR